MSQPRVQGVTDRALGSGYIGEIEVVDDRRAGKIVVQLIGRINKCGVISPRFDVALPKLENWVSYLMPSRQFGHIVLTTSYGIMDHTEARRKKTGGKILGFCELAARWRGLARRVASLTGFRFAAQSIEKHTGGEVGRTINRQKAYEGGTYAHARGEAL